jgi:hypothetical protein
MHELSDREKNVANTPEDERRPRGASNSVLGFLKSTAVNYENPIPRPISTQTAKCDPGRNAYLDYGRVVQRAAPQPREAYWES